MARQKKRPRRLKAQAQRPQMRLTKVSLKVQSRLATNNFKPLRLYSLSEIHARDRYLKEQLKAIDEQLYGGPFNRNRRSE